MSDDFDDKLDHGSPRSPDDLETARMARLQREARSQVSGLHVPAVSHPGGTSPEALAALAAKVRDGRASCEAIVRDLEKHYLHADQAREARDAEQARHAGFLEDYLRRLIYVGTDTVPRTWSHFGWVDDSVNQPVALSRDSGHVILASGIQGSGKTWLSTVLCEGSLLAGLPLTSSSLLPTAYVFFHLEEQDRLPQLLDGLRPNPNLEDLAILKHRLGVGPLGLPHLRLAVPEDLLEKMWPRLKPYMDLGLEVVPLKVHLSQLGRPGLEGALGADSGAFFLQRIIEEALRRGDSLELHHLHEFVDREIPSNLRQAAHARLDRLKDVASPPGKPGLWEMVGPGVATVIYLGGPYLAKGRLLPLLVGLLNGLMLPSALHGAFQRLIAVDEVNLVDRDEEAWQAFTRVGRLVRHLGSTLLLMGQDLMCVPDELFGLAGLVATFQLRNPRIFEHLRERVAALRGWRSEQVAGLGKGWALMSATLTTDPEWQQATRLVRVRQLRCEHGGRTRAMI